MKGRLDDGCSTDDLCKWVVAIAFGKAVLVDGGRWPRERFRLQLALGRERNMSFTQKFASRHPELAKITSAIAGCSESKWRVRPAGGACSRNAWEIDSHASFVRLLRSMMEKV